MISNPDKEVFKLQFAVCEFDMVVYDPMEVVCRSFEVKHRKEIVEKQYRHLVDEEKLGQTEFPMERFWEGPSSTEGGISP